MAVVAMRPACALVYPTHPSGVLLVFTNVMDLSKALLGTLSFANLPDFRAMIAQPATEVSFPPPV